MALNPWNKKKQNGSSAVSLVSGEEDGTGKSSSSEPLKQSPHDVRPVIKDLLKKHEKEITAVHENIKNDKASQDILKKAINVGRYDNIWILRYVLSHKKNIKAASKAAIATIHFRETMKLNELGDIRNKLVHFHECPNDGSPRLPQQEQYASFWETTDAVINTHPDKKRGLILYLNFGMLDQDKVAVGMDDEEMKELYIYYIEACYQILDEVTRRTGLLTKQCRIVDVGSVHVRKLNRVYMKRDGNCTKAFEDYYPQFLGSVFIANAPSLFRVIWASLKPFFPKRFVEKVDLIPPTRKGEKKREVFKPLLKYISEEDLAERYGGTNKTWPLPSPGSQL